MLSGWGYSDVGGRTTGSEALSVVRKANETRARRDPAGLVLDWIIDGAGCPSRRRNECNLPGRGRLNLGEIKLPSRANAAALVDATRQDVAIGPRRPSPLFSEPLRFHR